MVNFTWKQKFIVQKMSQESGSTVSVLLKYQVWSQLTDSMVMNISKILERVKEHMRGKVLVTQLGPTLCNPTDWSLPGSSIHGILQARILEWVAIPFSRDLPD